MAFSVVADHQRQLVRIEHWERMSKDEMFEARASAGALLKEVGYLRLLVDVRRVEEAPDTMDTFSISTTHDTVLPPRFRLAVLVEHTLIADALFSENVAVNRGFNLKVFLEEADALEWLCQ